MSTPRRALVIDPSTNAVVNAILIDPEHPVTLPGQLVVEDEWGSGPGDAWDPAQGRPFTPVRQIGDPDQPVEILMDQKRAIIESRTDELMAALAAGNLEAAMTIIDQVHRAWLALEAATGG